MYFSFGDTCYRLFMQVSKWVTSPAEQSLLTDSFFCLLQNFFLVVSWYKSCEISSFVFDRFLSSKTPYYIGKCDPQYANLNWISLHIIMNKGVFKICGHLDQELPVSCDYGKPLTFWNRCACAVSVMRLNK